VEQSLEEESMKRKNLHKASYIVRVVSQKGASRIDTLEIQDNINGRKIDVETEKPALSFFLDLPDMLESLNWCLNCWANKTVVSWRSTGKASYGIVYLFA